MLSFSDLAAFRLAFKRSLLWRNSELITNTAPIDGSKRTILAVDDARSNLHILVTLCTNHGYFVRPVSNGTSALIEARRDPPDLILLDIDMPGMNGYEVCEKLKIDPQLKSVPVIFISAFAEQMEKVRAFSVGAVDYLTKPFHVEELHARIATHLRLRELQVQLEHVNANLADANFRMRQDLKAAARIQQTFLPNRPQKLPGIKFEWIFRPCDELAGDGLNIIPLDDDNVGIYVLDVSGHGVASALFAVTLSRLLSTPAEESSILAHREDPESQLQITPPAQVANRLNELFPLDSAICQYATLLYGILNIHSGEFRYVSAGHPGPVHLRHGMPPRQCHCGGFPIGVATESYEEQVLHLQTHDRLFLFSDGVPEAMNPTRELFGMDQFLKILSENAKEPLHTAIESVLAAISQWQQLAPFSDDVSLLAIEVG